MRLPLLPLLPLLSNALLYLPSQMPLHTEGPHIVTADNSKVNLACVNWYGAHMETYVNAGLHKRPLDTISADIVEAGFNCIRFPFSLDLYYNRDFVPPPVAVAADPTLQGLTGWEIFDLTIKSLTDAGLMVFLNNHNSKAAWCCDANSVDGLWSNHYYDAAEWVACLAGLADHFKDNQMVIGMDLRNEIHDVKNHDPPLYITWGETDDIDLDWKHAVEVSSDAIYEKNPDWLIIVSGLCFSFDLRKMHNDKPTLRQINKLVWTTHYYSFSRWWGRVESEMAASGAMGLESWKDVEKLGVDLIIAGCATFVGSIALLAAARRFGIIKTHVFPRDPSVMWSANGFILFMFAIVMVLILRKASVMVREGYEEAGCATMAIEADTIDNIVVIMWALAVVGGATGVGSCVKAEGRARSEGSVWQQRSSSGDSGMEMVASNKDSATHEPVDAPPASCMLTQFIYYFVIMNVLFLAIICAVGGGIMMQIAKKTDTYDMLHDELYDKWVLHDRSTPVLVGEFGTSTHDSDWWRQMMRFLDEYDLGYAYWPWNGERWYESDQSFGGESYGIVSDDWVTIKDPVQLADLNILANKEL